MIIRISPGFLRATAEQGIAVLSVLRGQLHAACATDSTLIHYVAVE